MPECSPCTIDGNRYLTIIKLPAQRQQHSVYWVFVHVGTISLILDPLTFACLSRSNYV